MLKLKHFFCSWNLEIIRLKNEWDDLQKQKAEVEDKTEKIEGNVHQEDCQGIYDKDVKAIEEAYLAMTVKTA